VTNEGASEGGGRSARVALDEIDYRILRELQFNARIINVQLAEKVGLSPSPCWNRFHRLENEGIIEKYVTIFNHEALGVPDTVIIEARLNHHDDEILRKPGILRGASALRPGHAARDLSGSAARTRGAQLSDRQDAARVRMD
jgi:hypothetical protein